MRFTFHAWSIVLIISALVIDIGMEAATDHWGGVLRSVGVLLFVLGTMGSMRQKSLERSQQ